MKVFLVFAALVAVAYGKVSLEAVFKAQWNTFKATHGKTYSLAEEPRRLQTFMKNAYAIALHNERFANGEVSYELGHNQFSDMDREEYKQTMLGFKMSKTLQNSKSNATKFTEKPGMITAAYVDWTRYTRTVKNQGQCGSCYTFSTTGALEGALARRYGGSYSLSEQNLVDCSQDYGNNGCDGGTMVAAFRYIQGNGGINDESDYPYEESVGTCRYSNYGANSRLASYVEVDQTETALEQALSFQGPVSVAIDASLQSFQLYSSGIYDDPVCSSSLDHAVLAVGYGSQGGRDYWIVKNSWGTGWGEGGFFRLAKGINRCGIANMCSYPVV